MKYYHLFFLSVLLLVSCSELQKIVSIPDSFSDSTSNSLSHISKLTFPRISYANTTNLLCYDTDVGMNLSAKGKVIVYDSSHTMRFLNSDSCANDSVGKLESEGSYVDELVCLQNTTPNVAYEHVRKPCLMGTRCFDGVCKSPLQLEQIKGNGGSYYNCDDVMRVRYNEKTTFKLKEGGFRTVTMTAEKDGMKTLQFGGKRSMREGFGGLGTMHHISGTETFLTPVNIKKDFVDFLINCQNGGLPIRYSSLELEILRQEIVTKASEKRVGPTGQS